MLSWAFAANTELSKLKCEQKLRTKVAYDRWVDNQLRLGAGALHQLTKRTAPPIEEAVYIHAAKDSAARADREWREEGGDGDGRHKRE